MRRILGWVGQAGALVAMPVFWFIRVVGATGEFVPVIINIVVMSGVVFVNRLLGASEVDQLVGAVAFAVGVLWMRLARVMRRVDALDEKIVSQRITVTVDMHDNFLTVPRELFRPGSTVRIDRDGKIHSDHEHFDISFRVEKGPPRGDDVN